jgi:hypothetical protein
MRILATIFLLLIFKLVFAEEVNTRFGLVSAQAVAASDSGYVVKLNGIVLSTYKVDDISLYRLQTPSDSFSYVIIEQWLPGLNCHKEYALIEIRSSSKALVSKNFGDCMELQGTTLTPDGVAVVLRSPFIKGIKQRSEQWLWSGGKLSTREIPDTSASESFRLYVNERYGYEISYPSSFVAHGVSNSGDGQIFTSPANDAELRASASLCLKGENLTPTDYILAHTRDEKMGKMTITYSKKGKNFAVVSGTAGTRIFYHKSIILDEWCTQFTFEYERSEKAKYDVITSRIASSFKP